MQNSHDAVKSLAQQIEFLAKQVQEDVSNGIDFLPSCNELTKHTMTLVFTSGEVFALSQRPVKVKVNNKSYYNVRDSRGRFVAKV